MGQELIKILIAGALLSSLFLVKKKRLKTTIAWILTAYLILLGAGLI